MSTHIRVRKFPKTFEDTQPNAVYQGSKLTSHYFNAMSLLFPEGERFFIRSVNKFANQITDPKLKEEIKAFAAQEVQHGKAHDDLNQNLEVWGYNIKPIEKNLKDLLKLAEESLNRIHPAMGLSITSALEHFTATQSEWFLRNRDFLKGMDKTTEEITLWHSCEEIEHKHVAFDVQKQVDDSYVLRVAGMMIGNTMIWGVSFAGAVYLMSQEKELTLPELAEDILSMVQNVGPLFLNSMKNFFDYFRPDFHPNDHDNLPLAEAYMAEYEKKKSA